MRKAAGKQNAGSFLICLILEGKRIVLREERETVAAIATALGEGGIGIIRISGDKALEIADAVLDRPISGAPGYSTVLRERTAWKSTATEGFFSYSGCWTR